MPQIIPPKAEETIKYSLVIPFKNEEENVLRVIEEIETIMSRLQEPWELICIEDGSTDRTKLILKQLFEKKKYLRLILFPKNWGQSSGFDAGFKAARGEFVITLDGDGQNDPADIPRLLALADQYDLLCGIRAKRQDSTLKRLTSKIANRVRNWICEDGVQDTGCSLKIMRRSCLAQIKMYHGMHRFLPALFKIEGFRIGQTAVNHRPRLAGTSHYSFFNRSFNTVADLWAVSWMKKRHLTYQGEEVGRD